MANGASAPILIRNPDSRPLQIDDLTLSVTTIYGTNWYPTDLRLADDDPMPTTGFHEWFPMAWFEDAYVHAQDALPRVVARIDVAAEQMMVRVRSRGAGRRDGVYIPAEHLHVRRAEIWFFYVASGQLVPALTVHTDTGLKPGRLDQDSNVAITNLLTACYLPEVRIDGIDLSDYVTTQARRLTDLRPQAEPRIALERYQVVIDGELPIRRQPLRPTNDPIDELVRMVLFRSHEELVFDRDDPEDRTIRLPYELNRNPQSFVAVSPTVTLMRNHDLGAEHTALASAVQAMAAASRLNLIHYATMDVLQALRERQSEVRGRAGEQDDPGEGERRPINWRRMHEARAHRVILERFSDRLGDIQLELGLTVEAVSDLGFSLPSLRATDYHDVLFEVMGMDRKTELVSRILDRIQKAIEAELTSVESAERLNESNRNLRWMQALGMASIVALPATLLAGFFGMNVVQAPTGHSMWGWSLLPWYAAACSAVAAAGLVFGGRLIYQSRELRRIRTAALAGSDLRPFTVIPRQDVDRTRPPSHRPRRRAAGTD